MTDESLSLAEQETVVTVTGDEENVHVWTAIRRHISRMRKHPSFTEVASGYHGSTEWVEFTIPSKEWNPASGGKRKRDMSEEQKEALRLRLARAREAQSG